MEALSTPELPEIDASTTPAASKEATPDAKTIDNMIERANADPKKELFDDIMVSIRTENGLGENYAGKEE